MPTTVGQRTCKRCKRSQTRELYLIECFTCGKSWHTSCLMPRMPRAETNRLNIAANQVIQRANQEGRAILPSERIGTALGWKCRKCSKRSIDFVDLSSRLDDNEAPTCRTQHRLTKVIDLTLDPADEAYHERRLHGTGADDAAVGVAGGTEDVFPGSSAVDEAKPPSVAFESMGNVTSRSPHLQTLQQAPDDDRSCFPADGHAVIEQGAHEASEAEQGVSNLETVAPGFDAADDSLCRRSVTLLSLYDHCSHGTASASATASTSNMYARELVLDGPTNDTNAADGFNDPDGMDGEEEEEEDVSFLKYLQGKAG
ncbi:hypothetical protein CALCODRAFT_170039 [Calocera cornea HHB12733]|uniref:Zinc finger PHD-type domain-containing protein n=1 Tax=Calocera cornea HHB12733 TaxID=1353952 RepID=A0A165CG73_9BASI|nr:hypothetical protein CALCODRAFT_170039 [Calocera cornea HHB12733]